MEKDEDIKLLLAEEQTLLSRERTMHSYMQTGLAFALKIRPRLLVVGIPAKGSSPLPRS